MTVSEETELLKLCQANGLTPADLCEDINELHTSKTDPGSKLSKRVVEAKAINSYGLVTQLHYLCDVTGFRSTVLRLRDKGGILKALGLVSTSRPRDLYRVLGADGITPVDAILEHDELMPENLQP